MRVILVRHAEAHPVGEAGADTDAARPLTARGHRQAAAVAAAFRAHGVAPAAVFCSGLVRAVQTAEPLVGLMPAGAAAVTELLSPAGFRRKKLAREVGGRPGPVVLVGHNPSLGEFARWLLDAANGAVELEKAAAALFDCPGGPAKGTGVLRWLVPPGWLPAPAG